MRLYGALKAHFDEKVNTADKKVEKYIGPDGKVKFRMVPVDQGVEKDKKENVKEAIDQKDLRLKQLARMGLVDKSDIIRMQQALKKMKEDKPLSLKEKDVILNMVSELINIVTGDTTIFQKTKKSLSQSQ